MREVTGQDLINVFNSKLGLIGLRYFIENYYHPLSFVGGNAQETAYNEGKRAVVVYMLDSMRAADPKITARMLSDVEYLALESKTKRCGSQGSTDSDIE